MIAERRGTPYVILFTTVVVVVVGFPMLLGSYGEGEPLSGFVVELLNPLGFLLLPIVLVLLIQYLSSTSRSFLPGILSSTKPTSIHNANDNSPIGTAFVLLLVIVLLYIKLSIFGGDEDSDE